MVSEARRWSMLAPEERGQCSVVAAVELCTSMQRGIGADLCVWLCDWGACVWRTQETDGCVRTTE